MTTGNTFQDSVVGAFKALFDQAVNETSQSLHYLKLGYTDDEIAVENEQRNQISGPSPGVLTGEGVEYGEIEKYRGFPITLTTRKFALSYSFTEEVIDALQRASNMNMTTNEITNAASNLVAGLNQNLDTNAADVFYLGFGTTSSASHLFTDVKSALINGENLKDVAKHFMATLNKIGSKITFQLQRLSERRMQNIHAIVRTA